MICVTYHLSLHIKKVHDVKGYYIIVFYKKDKIMINYTILKKNTIGKIENINYFNIVYGVDKKFTFGALMSIISIINKNAGMNINFNIFTDSDFDDNKLKKALEKTGCIANIYIIDADSLNNLPTASKAWSKAIYFRLIAIYELSKTIDNMLYLDADIICNGSISDLLNLSFSDDTYLYAVIDKYISEDTKNNNYFNSGFLYLSAKKMTDKNIPSKVIEMVATENFSHPDQDALNILLKEKTKYLNEKFNFLFSIDSYLTKKGNKITIPNDVIFIHFVGVTKPFHNWAIYYDEYKYLDVAKRKSPWKRDDLLKPEGYKQISRKKAHLRKNKKYGQYIFNFIYYIILKIKSKK